MIKRLLTDKRGVGMLMVIAFMGLAVPLITGALALSGTLSKDSYVKTEILKRQYCALGGDEFGRYAIIEGLPDGDYPIPCSGTVATVTLGGLPPILFPPPSADNQRRFQTLKVVTPTTASATVMETFTYTITITNRDDDVENLNKIDDELPPDFAYVPGSTSGVTTADPSISGQVLSWNVSETLDPGDVETLTFQAAATLNEGNYCNEASVTPGGPKTSSLKTARVKVGSPATELCTGPVVQLTTDVELEPGTFMGGDVLGATYTVTIENIGTDDLELDKVENLIPAGFTYLVGTIGGTLTSDEPGLFNPDSRLMKWNFNPKIAIPSGESRTITYEAEGVFAGGHWNETWLEFTEFSDSIYSWPSAGIEVIDVRDSTSLTPTGSTVYAVYYQLAAETFLLWEWEIYN